MKILSKGHVCFKTCQKISNQRSLGLVLRWSSLKTCCARNMKWTSALRTAHSARLSINAYIYCTNITSGAYRLNENFERTHVMLCHKSYFVLWLLVSIISPQLSIQFTCTGIYIFAKKLLVMLNKMFGLCLVLFSHNEDVNRIKNQTKVPIVRWVSFTLKTLFILESL